MPDPLLWSVALTSMCSIRPWVNGFNLVDKMFFFLLDKIECCIKEDLRLTPFSSAGDEQLLVNNNGHNLDKS